MATENEANKARNIHAGYLGSLGAHAIGVDEIVQGNNKTFAVIAYTEKKHPQTPSHLEIIKRGKSLKIPLIVKVATQFKLQ